MSFSIGPKGGIQDPVILQLLSQLTILVKKHSYPSPEVSKFIDSNKNILTVDDHSQHMYSFKEIAETLSPLIQGIKFNVTLPGDKWQSGSIEDMFSEPNPDEPADWWK